MPTIVSRCILPLAVASLLSTSWSIQARDFGSMSEEERKELLGAHIEIQGVDHILVVCNELAPDYVAANQAIMADFKTSRSIDKARPITDRFAAWLEARDTKGQMALALTIPLVQKAVRDSLEKEPEKCAALFESELEDSEFGSISSVVQAYGLGAADNTANQATSHPVETAASEPEPAAATAQPTTAVSAAEIGMPTPIGDRVEELPGISWKAMTGVRDADSGGAYCVWRCLALEYDDGDDHFPWLIIHEAVPLGADAAVDQLFALTDAYEVISQEVVDAESYRPHMAMKPDGLAIRNTTTERYSKENKDVFFALEKDGLTTIAQLHYSARRKASEVAQEALTYVITQLHVDPVLIKAELANNPIAPSIESARGAPPIDGQVIYAETPNSSMNALTLSLSYDDDVRYLDTSVLDSDGPVIDMNESTYYYVPPQPDGAMIEGVFTSADGYAGVGISVLKSETLVFNRNGRYTTSSSSGVVGGFLASAGGSSEGEGSYRINGYTLELRSDDGTTQSDVFFPYLSRTFWPGSDGPADEVNFINVGGKILYRDDG